MSSDSDEKRIREIVRDELSGVSRRGVLAGGAGLLGSAALGGYAGRASAQSSSNGYIGSEQNPASTIYADTIHAGTLNELDLEGADLSLASLSTGELGNGPIVFSSEFESIQSALDAAGSGTILIDDTKTEEGIEIGPGNDGIVIEWVGDNWVEQPANPTPGTAVFQSESNTTDGNGFDVTFVRPRIRNPSLTDSDIGNEDSVSGPDRSGAIVFSAPNVTSADAHPRRWTVIGPHIHHVNGYGVAIQNPTRKAEIRNGHIYQTAYDGCYTKADIGNDAEGCDVIFDGVLCEDNGRHNFAVAGDAVEDSVYISGTGKRAYTAGIDLEQALNATVDAEIFEPSQNGETGSVQSGLNIDGSSDNVSGRVHIHDPQNFAASIGAPVDDLTVITEQSETQNPAGTSPVVVEGNVTGHAGKLTVIGRGGGGVFGLVNMTTCNGWNVEVVAQDAYGAALRLNRSKKNTVHVTSMNAVQGGTSVDASSRAHLLLNGLSDGESTDNDITITAIDDDGNVEDAIRSNGNSDFNQIRGNVRDAYSTSATSGLGSNTDTSNLIG